MIESHEKEIAKVSANKEVYTAIANSSWKKEEDLRSLKAQAAELDRKIALTLSPSEEEEKEDIQREVGNTEKTENATIQNSKIESTLHPPQCVYLRSDKHILTNEETQVSKHIGIKPKWK